MASNRPRATPPASASTSRSSSLRTVTCSSSSTQNRPHVEPAGHGGVSHAGGSASALRGRGGLQPGRARRTTAARSLRGRRSHPPLLPGRGHPRGAREAGPRREASASLSLATGSGKTFIAVNLLKRIADAGQLRRALFVCDRDELRGQGLGRVPARLRRRRRRGLRGAGRAEPRPERPHPRRHVPDPRRRQRRRQRQLPPPSLPENYFSHIVIDECHRSAWGKWSEVLRRNPDAVQVGLTATPRELEVSEGTAEAKADAQISADNLRHFGEPVYEYDIGQGIEDGYLAACEIVRRDIFLDRKPQSERETASNRRTLPARP